MGMLSVSLKFIGILGYIISFLVYLKTSDMDGSRIIAVISAIIIIIGIEAED